jgi:signal transduction histidine kinase
LEQLTNSRKYNKTGTGIGLAISKKLVESLGGKIKLKSEETVGTTITFSVIDIYQEYHTLQKVSIKLY